MTGQEAIAYIHSYQRKAHAPGLDRMRILLDRLGNPQKQLRFVHVAGTNGKGCTCACMAAVLLAAILLFHVLVNVGMTIGLMPVMGIPLPFMSYGGSSLIAFTILLFIAVRLDASTRQFSLNNKF